MWPILLDMTKDECKRMLRRLELEAYGSLVSALRAQGGLSTEKHKVLQDIATTLNISPERHRAEIRRAVNDERLATIAHCMTGDDTTDEWAVEGRRLIPLMPRLPPQTAYSVIADEEANKASIDNEKLPHPANTERKRTLQNNISENKSAQFRVSPDGTTKHNHQNAIEDINMKKRRTGINMESSTLAQHLMMAPPKISRLQQIYRQKTKAILKSQTKQRAPQPMINNVPKSIVKEDEPSIKEMQKMPEVKVVNPITSNENQVPKTKSISVSRPPVQSTSNLKIQTSMASTEITSKSIKICPAQKLVASTRPHTAPQKVIIVSTAQGTSTSSILQRTLTIPFVKTISMKNLDKVKVITSTTIQTVTSNIVSVANTKPKLLTVQAKMKNCTPGKTVNIPFIQGVQLQALQTKGAIKMLPLSTTVKTTTANPLYIVNSNLSVSGVTTANNSPIMTSKVLTSDATDTKSNIYILKNEDTKQPVTFVSESKNDNMVLLNMPSNKSEQKSSVLAEILKASGVIPSDESETYQEPDIENEITQFTQITKSSDESTVAEGIVSQTDESYKEVQVVEQYEETSSEQETNFVIYSNKNNSNQIIVQDNNKVVELLGNLNPETGLYNMKEDTLEKDSSQNYVIHMEHVHSNEIDMPVLNMN